MLESEPCRYFDSSRKHAFFDQRLAVHDTVADIDRQYFNRRATNWRKAHENGAMPRKVVIPLVLPWMKKSRDVTCSGVDACDVRPFVVVAREARKRQVF
jgi:hypothetical protein